MNIRYNPLVPINFRFLFCIMFLFIFSIWIEVYVLYENSLSGTLYALFSFWVVVFIHEAIQNKFMNISKITIELDKIIVTQLDKKYIFSLNDVFIKETLGGCIKILKISTNFELSSIYINAGDFSKLEKRFQSNKIYIENSKLSIKILLFATIVLSIIVISNIFNIGFDGLLYSIICLYLIYQIFKKKA